MNYLVTILFLFFIGCAQNNNINNDKILKTINKFENIDSLKIETIFRSHVNIGFSDEKELYKSINENFQKVIENYTIHKLLNEDFPHYYYFDNRKSSFIIRVNNKFEYDYFDLKLLSNIN